ncbi:MAG: hypothetical protein WBP26_05220 [Candidatus Saccharimonadales bacterium]
MQLTPEEQQVIDKLKEVNNVLVTVNANPTVDQLAACLGMTIALNKAGKHATAVFSGEVPSTLEFLKPEETLEKNTDSLRDFIISLDKAKADKLRYKVEDNVVKIFITPYRTAISESDFEYSQGDFNVQAIVALGVRSQQDLDEVIRAHGRILHDATVVSINLEPGGELGSINITDTNASSLSEVVTILLQNYDGELLDGQISTALLTGVVAETARFSNEKTTPTTMSVSSVLMTAGANQQLVATKLESPKLAKQHDAKEENPSDEKHKEENHDNDEPPVSVPPKEPGMLEIAHESSNEDEKGDAQPREEKPKVGQIDVDEDGLIKLRKQSALPDKPEERPAPQGRMITQPPTIERSNFTANSTPEADDIKSDLSLPPVAPSAGPSGGLVIQPLPPPEEPKQEEPVQVDPPAVVEKPVEPEAPKPFNLSEALAQNDAGDPPINSAHLGVDETVVDSGDKPADTLAVLEEGVASSHLNDDVNASDLDSARRAVEDAVASLQEQVHPLESLNAQPLNLEVEENLPETPQAVPSVQPVTPGPLPAAEPAPLAPVAVPAEQQPLQMPQPTFAPPSEPAMQPAAAAASEEANPLAVGLQPDAALNAQPLASPQANPVASPVVFDPNSPPPLPPPMTPQSFGAPKS